MSSHVLTPNSESAILARILRFLERPFPIRQCPHRGHIPSGPRYGSSAGDEC
jgi:hypothetical protein